MPIRFQLTINPIHFPRLMNTQIFKIFDSNYRCSASPIISGVMFLEIESMDLKEKNFINLNKHNIKYDLKYSVLAPCRI